MKETKKTFKEDNKPLILLVEDDPMIVEMYRTRLMEDGFEVMNTDRGSEAINIAQTKKPVAVLLDVILPEVDGFSILQTLKADIDTKDIPVLLLTNLGQEADYEKGLSFGAAGYFVKAQHTPGEVLTKVKQIMGNKTE